MANQRSPKKKVLSLPILTDLLDEVEAEAESLGIPRTEFINRVLAEELLRRKFKSEPKKSR